jgi:hypothetical protein
MRWTEHVARVGGRRGTYGVLLGRPGGKRPLGRPGVHGETILRWIFKKCGGCMEWIDLAQVK